MVDGKVSVFDASRSPEGVARYVAGRLLAGEGQVENNHLADAATITMRHTDDLMVNTLHSVRRVLAGEQFHGQNSPGK
jgi:hypothetical protein